MNFLIQGWLLGVAYVAPIGMQNMYIINTSMEKPYSHAIKVALIMIFFDISLALSCFYGIGLVLDRFEIIKMLLLGIGSLAVTYIGIQLLRAKPEIKKSDDINSPLLKIFVSCFIVTWLNPQALLDGTLLLAGFKATLGIADANMFIIGVCLASITWFVGLSSIISTFKKVISVNIIKYINTVCGAIIILFGVRLALRFVSIYVL